MKYFRYLERIFRDNFRSYNLLLISLPKSMIMGSTDPKYINLVKKDFHVLSRSYDLINNFMSLGTDRHFRYLAIKNVVAESQYPTKLVKWLDIGIGTGHLANELHSQKPVAFVLGIDISKSMIENSKNRIIYKKGLLNLILADASKTPFRNESFDGAVSAFVGRHFINYSTTLIEHHRIIRPRGRLMMLEMGRRATPLSFLVDIYVGRLMTILGKIASFIITQGKAPFKLLEETYAKFYSPKELQKLFIDAGFKTSYKIVLLGSIVIVLAYKTPI